MTALLAGLDAYPAYYAHMGPANPPGQPARTCRRRAGPTPAELRRRIEAGEWVVDLRDRIAFAAGFVPGSFSFPLDGSFATYLGWVIPWGTPVTLLGRHRSRSPRRSGNWRGSASTGWPAAHRAAQDWSGGRPLATLRLATFGDLAAARRPAAAVVLDVRRAIWSGQEGHVAGALHIPFSDLPGRGWPRSRRARSGCTATAATAPWWPHPSWPPPAAG